jgi:hypothetical protein
MFPGGAAGYGLLVLRLCEAGMLMHSVLPDESSAIRLWALAGTAIVAMMLCLGALTPLGCGLSGLIQIVLLFRHSAPDLLHPVFSLLVTTAVFLIGPGAFSVDSRLFGRRLIIRS